MFDQRADAEKTGKRKGHIKKDDDERRPVGRRPRQGQAGIDDEKILHADGRDVRQPKRQALKIRKHGSLLLLLSNNLRGSYLEYINNTVRQLPNNPIIELGAT